VTERAAEGPKIFRSGQVLYATLDLLPKEHRDFYVGFANSALWPLCHYRLGLIDYRRQAYEGYLAVNARFARAIAAMVAPDDLIWVHDYHFLPLAFFLRELGVANPVGYFHHIPFPSRDVFSVLPDSDRFIGKLRNYDIIGLQTEQDARHLTDYLNCGSEGILAETLAAAGRATRVFASPVGIDVESFLGAAASATTATEMLRLKSSLDGRQLVLGVDRLDYTKGLPNRLHAFEELLTTRPGYRGKVTFMQIAPVSRGAVEQYGSLRRELETLAGHINGRFAEFDWMPVRYLNKAFPQQTLAGFYRVARVGLVTPLRDGMNLVAKEYVAAQDPADPGVLVLSEFAGAAAELGVGAIVVNPIDSEQIASALDQALSMPQEERRQRWAAMMEAVRLNSISSWRDHFIAALEETSRHSEARRRRAARADASFA
jgi:trehalose 6-phosphate synthase